VATFTSLCYATDLTTSCCNQINISEFDGNLIKFYCK